ncbi:MAG: sigma 54-interacting transcriptional regulator, partial [Candidatus Brocadiaceae bacterium]|nr:sigma 54-interacting transcriptional regulator [Candidatus Brocadiaceae bacterium]
MKKVLETVKSVSDRDATVLIRGESGTGKEKIAGAIHYHSIRRN